MPYLFLLIAVLAGATKGYCGKRTSGRITGWRDPMLANFIRMLLCILIGLGVVIFGGDLEKMRLIKDQHLNWIQLGIYLISGVSTAVFVVTWLVAVRSSAYVLMNVILMLGAVVPMLLGSICYGKPIEWYHWGGLSVLLVATLILCSYNNGVKKKMTFKGLLILVISGLANGITSFSQIMMQESIGKEYVSVFNFYTYLFSALTLGVVLLFVRAPKEEQKKPSALRGVIGYIIVMAICLFLNSFFLTKANEGLVPSQVYPLERGSSMILSGLMASLFFKEKMTVKAVVGLVLAFVGLLVQNLDKLI